MADWYKCTGGIWCDLFKLDLSDEYVKEINGVFIVWSGKTERSILVIGEGNISLELKKLKSNLAIKAFAHHGVQVTWCELSSMKRAGTAAYLSNLLSPKMRSANTGSIPIKINLPWESDS